MLKPCRMTTNPASSTPFPSKRAFRCKYTTSHNQYPLFSFVLVTPPAPGSETTSLSCCTATGKPLFAQGWELATDVKQNKDCANHCVHIEAFLQFKIFNNFQKCCLMFSWMPRLRRLAVAVAPLLLLLLLLRMLLLARVPSGDRCGTSRGSRTYTLYFWKRHLRPRGESVLPY